MSKNFAHLHCHSQYSLLDSTIRIPELIEKVRNSGMTAVAVTDHGVAAGLLQLYIKATSNQDKGGNSVTPIKPLLGIEAYLSPTDDHTLREKLDDHPAAYHLTLLAKNSEGVSNLYALSSRGWLEGFYYKPRISLPMIEKYRENLIAMGACIKGPISWNLARKRDLVAKDFAIRLKEIFGRDFYIELMDHGIPWQAPLNRKLANLASKLDIPLVATNDAHFLDRKDHYIHTLMMCGQRGKTIEELREADLAYPEECYVKTPEEILEGPVAKDFGEEVVYRTQKIADQIDIQLELGQTIFPPLPGEC